MHSKSVLLRPELTTTPDLFFDDTEASSYARGTRKRLLQSTIATHVVQYHLNADSLPPGLFLDIGCGTGVVGELLRDRGHECIGCDLSRAMLSASDPATRSTSALSDAGDGLPFRPATFDGCLSVSTLQWLCYDYQGRSATSRCLRFFRSLHTVLKPHARGAFQYFPEDTDHIDLLQNSASEAGFLVSLHKDDLFGMKHFFLISKVQTRALSGYTAMFCLPYQDVISRLLLGCKPSCRYLLKFSSERVPGDVCFFPHPRSGIKKGSPSGSIPGEILRGILMEMVVGEVRQQKGLDAGPDNSARSYHVTFPDSYELVSSARALGACKCVCKGWREGLAEVSLDILLEDYIYDLWYHQRQLPSFYLLRMERHRMLQFFIKSLLLPRELLKSSMGFSEASYDCEEIVQTQLWIDALREQQELFYLKQFFLWMQLLKYTSEEEIQSTLVPPSEVFLLWSIYVNTAAYPSFCKHFTGRYLLPKDCKAIGKVDMQQSYRELSWKQKMRSGGNIPPEPEYSLRMRTFSLLESLTGEVPHDYLWHPDACDLSCFGGETLILMGDGSFKQIRCVRVGDDVLCGDGSRGRVLRVEVSLEEKVKEMVWMDEEFWITRGHPVWVDGDWYRPDERWGTIKKGVREVGGLFNLRLDGSEHTVRVGRGKILCCTLGKYCGERLEKLYPNQNLKYGPTSF